MSGHRKALKARRRIGPPDRGTAHRRFTTLQRDPTGKATLKYARSKCKVCDPSAKTYCGVKTCVNVDVLGIKTLLERYAVTYSGMKEDKRGYLRVNKKTKANGLAAWAISRYETMRKMGTSPHTALALLNESEIRAAVDSGEVGRWCATQAAKAGRVKNRGLNEKNAKKWRENGPRTGHQAEKARWKVTGDKFREGMKVPTTEDGVTKGQALVAALEIIKKAGIKPPK